MFGTLIVRRPIPSGVAFCSGVPTPAQRQALAAAHPRFPITGTAGSEEMYFGGEYGLVDHLSEMGRRVVRFTGKHCEEEEADTLEEVGRRLLGIA